MNYTLSLNISDAIQVIKGTTYQHMLWTSRKEMLCHKEISLNKILKSKKKFLGLGNKSYFLEEKIYFSFSKEKNN